MPLSINAVKYVFNHAKPIDENNFCYTKSLTANLLDDLLKATPQEVCHAAKIRNPKGLRIYSSNLKKIIWLYNKHTKCRNSLIKNNNYKNILHIFLKIITFSIAGLTDRIIDVASANKIISEMEKLYAVNLIEAAWLKRKNFIAPYRRARSTIEKWNNLPPPLPANYDVLRERALKLKKIYVANHYLFIHGQSQQISVLTTLNKVFIKRFHNKGEVRSQQSFRVPETIPKIQNVRAFHSKYPRLTDNSVRNEIMSVDGDFFNTTSGESAYSYTKSNSNVLTSGAANELQAFQNLVGGIVKHYLQDQYLIDELATRIVTIATQKQRAVPIGALYLIAIPKEVVEDPSRNFVYRSHQYGWPCRCHTETDMDSHDALKNGTMPSCNSTEYYRQYRILTARLVEEPGVKVHRLTTIPKATRVAYRELIHRTGLEIVLCQNLENVCIKPSKELWDLIYKDVGVLLDRYQKTQTLEFAKEMRPLFFPLLKTALNQQGHLLDADKRVMLTACLDERR